MAARRDGDPAAGGGRGLQRRGRLDILVEIGSILEGHLGERPGRIAEAPQLVGREVRMRDVHQVSRLRPLQPRQIVLAIGRGEMQWRAPRSEEHTSELQSLMRTSYAVYCLKYNTKKS